MLAAESTSSGGGLLVFLPLILMMGGLWFLMSRQNRTRRQQAQQVQSRIEPGSEIMTTAGLFGTVVDFDEATVTIEVSPGVTNRYARAAIAKIVDPPQPTQAPEELGADQAGPEDVNDPGDVRAGDGGAVGRA